MKNIFITMLIFFSAFSIVDVLSQTMETEINIIPKPKSIILSEGTFKLNADTKIFYKKEAKQIAEYLFDIINASTGFDLRVIEWNNKVEDNSIIISLSNSSKNTGTESYTLVVNSNNVMIEAAELNGLFYGVQTLRQLLPNEIESKVKVENVKWIIPNVVILDEPEFLWRGLNLDCCRHFMTKEFVKRYIDLLAFHKFNTLHWHLTEDQAWRIEIKKYPELTKKGAFRTYDDGSVYGGYYTQEDIKEVVEYAASRFINVVPEIEMPGHSTAAISTYPNLSCTGGPFEVGTFWGIYKDIYCAGNEETFKFLEDVLSEVIELFPSKYIHIGGDEAPKDRWKNCLKCQARIKSENLKDEHELQSYFVKRMEKFINSKGKQIIGWDEILEGGLAPEATVQSWRGVKGAIDAAKQGHDVIVSPTSHCYFDYPVDVTDMQKVYLFDPVPAELTADERKHVLGSEGNMWSEYAPQELIDDRLFPRMLALSEVVWTYPTERNYEEFRQRVQKHYNRLDVLGVNYGLETKPFEIVKVFNENTNAFDLQITLLQKDIINYVYSKQRGPIMSNPIGVEIINLQVPKSEDLEFSFAHSRGDVGKVFKHSFTFNKATRKNVNLTFPFSSKYPSSGDGALTDGLRGSDSFRGGDKSWQGFQGTDFEATIDLGELTDINKMSIGFFQASSSWVVFPEYIEFFSSEDGNSFSQVGKVDIPSSVRNPDWVQKDFSVEVQNTKGRYIKIFAKNLPELPSYHPEAGGKPWLMVDEIIVE